MRAIAKSKYVEWITDDGLAKIEEASLKGWTDEQIAKDLIGINRITLYDWKTKYPNIDNALKKGRRSVLATIVDTLKTQKFVGYYKDEVTEEITISPNGDKTQHKKIVKRWIPADTTSIIFWLKCRFPEMFNDKFLETDTTAIDKLDSILSEVKANANESKTK